MPVDTCISLCAPTNKKRQSILLQYVTYVQLWIEEVNSAHVAYTRIQRKYQHYHVILLHISEVKCHRLKSGLDSHPIDIHNHKYRWTQDQKIHVYCFRFCSFESSFDIVCCQLLDKITAEVYFRLVTFKQLLSPACSVASGYILISTFSSVSSERESTEQEKGESQDYVALEVFVGLK